MRKLLSGECFGSNTLINCVALLDSNSLYAWSMCEAVRSGEVGCSSIRLVSFSSWSSNASIACNMA